MWVGANATPRPLYLRVRDPLRGWVSSRAGLNVCGKSRLPPGIDPRTTQLVANRYTDCAIANHKPAIENSFVYESSLSSCSVCVCVCVCVCVWKVSLGSRFGYKQGQNLGSCVCKKKRLIFGGILSMKSVRFWICTCINSFRIGYFTLLHKFPLTVYP